jgi:hypothetical protein
MLAAARYVALFVGVVRLTAGGAVLFTVIAIGGDVNVDVAPRKLIVSFAFSV